MPPAQFKALGSPKEPSNDWVDCQLLAAVYRDSVDYLITNDEKMHKRAASLGIRERVLTLKDAVDLLERLSGKVPVHSPAVRDLPAYSLNDSDPIFDGFRDDYRGFDDWLRKSKREGRQAWVVEGDGTDYAGVCIVKDKSDSNATSDRTLKICSFKVSENYSGFRFGELLLKTVFDYAYQNGYTYLYVTVFEKYAALIALLEDFGFRNTSRKTPLGEAVLDKRLNAVDLDQLVGTDTLDYTVLYGPFVLNWPRDRAFVVPIRPDYHSKLFPQAEKQLALIDPKEPFGNSMKKAYLCNSQIRQLRPGDVLLFYRSEDVQGITAIGVLERRLISANAEKIARFVGNRTVYSYDEIRALCQRKVLALVFRYVRTADSAVFLGELTEGKVISAAPQTICKLDGRGYRWIRDRLKKAL